MCGGLVVKITIPTVSAQRIQQIAGERTLAGSHDIAGDACERPHAWNHSGYRGRRKAEADRDSRERLRPVQSQVPQDCLHAVSNLLLPFAAEIVIAEIAFRENGSGSDAAGE